MEMSHDQTPQEWQLSMKEVADSRDHRYGQVLGPSPVHHIIQWNGVILLAMHNQSALV
jgi:hypothetical protein